MRILVSHRTSYRYTVPAKSVIQMLRLTPRNHEGQYVVNWRIDVSADCRLVQQEDAFGNCVHVFTADGPLEALEISVEGEVETREMQGVVRDAIERFPPGLYLRETNLTTADAAIAEFANDASQVAQGDQLRLLHELTSRLHENITFDTDPTHTATTAAEAFSLRRGVCQDLSHILIAACRSLSIPARYIGGHLYRTDGATDQEAGHAWVEAFVPDLGWVAFDATNGICATEGYIRIASGLDYLGAAPVRGTRSGGSDEALTVAVRVEQAMRQEQN